MNRESSGHVDVGPQPFFDRYPRFYSTSEVGASPNRLNQRYNVLIGNSADLIEAKSVLDIGSHDGRWSFAALMNGATHVTGIEARPALVEEARNTFGAYQVDRGRYRFETGDVLEWLPQVAPGSFDTIFVFGFLYHTMHHMRLMENIERLAPTSVVIDTEVIVVAERPLIVIREEDSRLPSSGIAAGDRSPMTLVGIPSRDGIKLLLDHIGYDIAYYSWHDRGIGNWDDLVDYREGRRVSLRATLRRPPAAG